MKPSILNQPIQPTGKLTTGTIWSFDLGKASIGEAVRDLRDDSFPHAESLLIPFEFAQTKSAAGRRRMWRTRIAHHAREEWLAGIVRLVGFERADVEREIATLAEHEVEQWPALRAAFTRIRAEGWQYTESATGKVRTLPVVAETFGEFLVHGPGGAPSEEARADFHHYLEERRARGLRPGTEDDWQSATGQKTPRFDNRIVEDCGLLDGLRVCGVGVRYDAKTKAIAPESLLYAEVTFLMKLKNTRIHAEGGQPALVCIALRVTGGRH